MLDYNLYQKFFWHRESFDPIINTTFLALLPRTYLVIYSCSQVPVDVEISDAFPVFKTL